MCRAPYIIKFLRGGGHSLSSVYILSYSYTHPHTPSHTHTHTQMITASYLAVQTRVVVTLPTRNLLFLFTEESVSTSDMEECPR